MIPRAQRIPLPRLPLLKPPPKLPLPKLLKPPLPKPPLSSWWQMAEDNNVAYWAAMSYQGQDLVGEVWSFRLDDPESDPEMHSFTVPDAPGEISMLLKFDVDDGVTVIQPRFRGFTDSRLILYDLNTGAVDLVDTGLRIFDVQVLRLGE